MLSRGRPPITPPAHPAAGRSSPSPALRRPATATATASNAENAEDAEDAEDAENCNGGMGGTVKATTWPRDAPDDYTVPPRHDADRNTIALCAEPATHSARSARVFKGPPCRFDPLFMLPWDERLGRFDMVRKVLRTSGSILQRVTATATASHHRHTEDSEDGGFG